MSFHSSKILNIFMKIIQTLGVFSQIKESKQSCGLLVKPYAPDQANCCGMIYILHLVSPYHKNKYLLGAPWQEPEATKEIKIMLKISAERYGQVVSLSTV